MHTILVHVKWYYLQLNGMLQKASAMRLSTKAYAFLQLNTILSNVQSRKARIKLIKQS